MVDSYSYNTRSLSMVMRGAGSRLGELTALFFCEFAVDGNFDGVFVALGEERINEPHVSGDTDGNTERRHASSGRTHIHNFVFLMVRISFFLFFMKGL
jgi:hypothetical protein